MQKLMSSLTLGRALVSVERFRNEERGSMALIILFTFLAMIMFGGIAVDVMRFETRRVALQQTLDRAALAAASLEQTRTPEAIAADWFDKAGIGRDLAMVQYTTPTVTSLRTPGQRRVTMSARVRSYNYFMTIFSPNDFLEGPATTEAAEGVDQIEVMLVLDVTGSMGDPLGDGRQKIVGLRAAAEDFVRIVKENDSRNGVSIGMVPYSSQVNIPVALRQQFNVTNISSWDGVANTGVPNANCIEIPTSTYGSTALSQTDPMPMAAVADTMRPNRRSNNTDTTNTAAFVAPTSFPPSTNPLDRICSPNATDPTANILVFPSKNPAPLTTAIRALRHGGYTDISIGMRWGSALLDQAARPIYTAIGDSTVQGRPDNNVSDDTRKIIVLMTDGEHFSHINVRDAYKSGPSPIWRGTDGNFAIRFWSGGSGVNANARPTNCMGWTIPASANREYFLPHMKDTQERDRGTASTAIASEGRGTGTLRTLANTGSYNCDPNSWIAATNGVVQWPQTVADGSDADDERDVVLNSSGQPVMITATRLDWSEVWRYLRVSWVVRQLYNRSGVTGATDFAAVQELISGTYRTESQMNTLLQQNCAAARNAGIEIYGIAFAAPAVGQTQIQGCSSTPRETYYYNATSSAALLAAFREIAADIADLRLTQ
jgi:Flp pilus assembly protein TadG